MLRAISLHKTSLQGYRESNEDVEKFKINLSRQGTAIDPTYAPIDLFIICDGHGGKSVAEYVAPRLEKLLSNPKNSYPIHIDIIKRIYNQVQKELIRLGIASECGCTALVVIRYIADSKEFIQVINIGDCRAVLSKNGLAIPLSKDHKPHSSDKRNGLIVLMKNR